VAIALVESGAIIDGGAVEVNIGGEIVAAGMSVAPLFDPSGARMRQPQLVQAKSKVM
jgi:glycine cleavage system aminomethyltransferase T